LLLYQAIFIHLIMRRVKGSLSSVSLSIVLVATMITLTGFGISGVAHGQANTNTSSSLTPQQKAAICDPNNPKLNFVNTTESKICGIPTTPTNTTSSAAANTTTTGSEAPSVTPPLPTPGS
jgi:hypothetical protein